MVIAADAGILSAANLTALDEAGLKFIVGSRVTKAPGDLTSLFHWHGDVFTDGQIIDTVTPRHARSVVDPVKKRAEPIWDPVRHPTSWRAIWQYTRKRAVRGNQTLNAQEARARPMFHRTRDAIDPSCTSLVCQPGPGIWDFEGIEDAHGIVGKRIEGGVFVADDRDGDFLQGTQGPHDLPDRHPRLVLQVA